MFGSAHSELPRLTTAPPVNSFRNRLDKHWASQELRKQNYQEPVVEAELNFEFYEFTIISSKAKLQKSLRKSSGEVGAPNFCGYGGRSKHSPTAVHRSQTNTLTRRCFYITAKNIRH